MSNERTLKIRELYLPSQFVTCVERGVLRRTRGSWVLHPPFDAYGNPLETELSRLYETPEKILSESDRLSQDFPPIRDNLPDPFCSTPGFIPYINDFSEILTFGTSGDGAPFAFDYRASTEPTVIWWADAYWHRVAPSFAAFLGLFHVGQST